MGNIDHGWKLVYMKGILLVCIVALAAADGNITHTLVAGFPWLNFTFPDAASYQAYFNNAEYTCCMLAGIKVNSKGRYFVSVPRWAPNVPATLSTLVNQSGQMLLEPFPSWSQNIEGDPTALQSVLGFEIDAKDRIWVLDQGKVNSQPAIPGSQKLVVFDSNTGDELMRFDLTAVTDPQRSFLNDVVVDTYREVAYITDSGISTVAGQAIKGGLIVVDYGKNVTRRVLDSDESVEDDPSLWVTVNGERVNANAPMETGADGIALSCDGSTLYYTPLTSRTLYSIPTEYLRDWTKPDLSPYITNLGYKLSASDGLASSYSGSLFLTAIENNGIYLQYPYPKSPLDFDYHQFTTIVENTEEMMWPDTIGFDDTDQSLVFVSNQLHHFVGGTMNFLNPKYGLYNFRIWKVMVDDRSYVHGCGYGSGSDRSSGFPGWAIAVVVVGSVIILALGGVACWKYRQGHKYDKEMFVAMKATSSSSAPIN